MKSTDGTLYEGDFKKGKPEGEGQIFWSETKKYKGSFKEGKLHGKGLYINGDIIYEGKINILCIR